jgi:hypothetical protein
MMKLFDILKLEMPSLKPEECKIHLATMNKAQENPSDVFLAGNFVEWQSKQNHATNFNKRYIVSLIKMREHSKWLFAGVHFVKKPPIYQIAEQYYLFKTEEVPELIALTGRLIIQFSRSGRNPYRIAENCSAQLKVSEMKPRRLVIEEFSGFTNVLLPKSKLDIIVTQEIDSWKSALSSVAGVYLITDKKTGRHYVGSAYGAGGIWGRWVAYSESGHGNNKILKSVLRKEGAAYSLNFQFSILETADTNASEDEILERETHWKDALCSRERHGGYNTN